MYLKRQKVPKNWPIHRKGTKYVIRPKANFEKGIPLLIVLRDMMKVVQNRKEAKKALFSKKILLNNKLVRDEKSNVQLLDTITLVPSKKSYRLGLTENGKFSIGEIKEADANNKIVKITNKKTLKRKATQLNLSDGRNFLSDIKCNVNDSVVIDFKNKKIEKCLPLAEKAKVVVLAGKHAGKKGVILEINLERKMTKLEADKETINVLIKQLIVVE